MPELVPSACGHFSVSARDFQSLVVDRRTDFRASPEGPHPPLSLGKMEPFEAPRDISLTRRRSSDGDKSADSDPNRAFDADHVGFVSLLGG